MKLSKSRRGALSDIVWAIVGILASVTLGAIIYTLMTGGISSSAQIAVNGYLIGNSKLIVDIRNIGVGEVRIKSIKLFDSSGNEISNCELSSVSLNNQKLKLPITIRPGQVLSIYFEGSQCYDVYTIVVYTNYGIYRGYVSS